MGMSDQRTNEPSTEHKTCLFFTMQRFFPLLLPSCYFPFFFSFIAFVQLLKYCTGWVRTKTQKNQPKTNAYAHLPAHCIYSIIIFIIWSLLLILFFHFVHSPGECTAWFFLCYFILHRLLGQTNSTVASRLHAIKIVCLWTETNDCVCLSANTVHLYASCKLHTLLTTFTANVVT